MARLFRLLFGLTAYVVFFLTFLYAIGFTAGVLVPKGIDDGIEAPLLPALLVNLGLLTLFALQHSVMARPGFKRFWLLVVPASIERSMFVLLASLALLLLFWQWRPLPAMVWQVTTPAGVAMMWALFVAGWLIVLVSTFLISHMELFGVRQVLSEWAGLGMPHATFRTPGLYRLVRHPIYLGFIVAFWAAPTMTVGHLVFAVVTTAYILIGIQLEERDLIGLFGDGYRGYRRRVGMLIPRRPRHPELKGAGGAGGTSIPA